MKLIAYLATVFFATISIFYISGYEENNFWSSPALFKNKPIISPPLTVHSLDSLDKDTSPYFFRENEKRTAYVNQKINPHLNPQYITTIENFNIHAASKSSVLALDDGYVIATDHGLLGKITSSGKLVWSLKTNTSPYGFHSTPAKWNKSIIAGDYKGLLSSLDSESGKARWLLQLGDTFGASPLITPNGDIIVSVETNEPNGFVAKISAHSGEIKWLSPYLGDHSHSSPAKSEDIIVVGDNDSNFSGINEADGSFLWRYKAGGPIKSTPTIWNNFAYFSSWDGYLHKIDIQNGFLVWKISLGSTNQSSAAILEEYKAGYIMTSKGLCRFNLEKNVPLICEDKAAGRNAKMSSPLITKSLSPKYKYLIWASCDDTNFCVHDADSLKRINTWKLPSNTTGEPRAFNNKIIIMTQEKPGLVIFE